MSEIKVILLCTSRFAIPAMQEMNFFQQLAAVAIPAYAKEMLEEVEVLLRGTPVKIITLQKTNYVDQLASAIKEHLINMGLIMTFPYRIPASVYTIPEKGFYNVHPGPLPEYRGADPVFQQIKSGETKAGVTIHKVEETFDSGGIVAREMIKLDITDTHGLLTAKLAQAAALKLRSIIKLASMDMTIHSKQQDETKARYFKRQDAKDITIDWQSMQADSIVALINAGNPWNKGGVSKLNGKIIRLVEAEKLKDLNPAGVSAGTIISVGHEGLDVASLNGESVRVRIVYTDEGFFSPARLTLLGMQPGDCFEIL